MGPLIEYWRAELSLDHAVVHPPRCDRLFEQESHYVLAKPMRAARSQLTSQVHKLCIDQWSMIARVLNCRERHSAVPIEPVRYKGFTEMQLSLVFEVSAEFGDAFLCESGETFFSKRR